MSLEATDEIPDAEVSNVVVQGIAGEIAAPDVFFDAAVDVVTNDAAFVVVRVIVIDVVGRGAKGGNLDDLAAESHVRQPEPAPDKTAVRKQRTHLVRRRVRGHVKVLGVQPHHGIAYATADQECLKAGFIQSVQYLQRALRDFVPGYAVSRAGNDRGTFRCRFPGVLQMIFA